MAKHTQRQSGSSFHGTVIRATPSHLVALFPFSYYKNKNEYGEGDGKTNFNFSLETDDGEYFTIYDWKYYRQLDMNEIVEWHIGGKNQEITEKAAEELKGMLLFHFEK